MAHSVKSSLITPRVLRLEIDRIDPIERREQVVEAMRQYAFAGTRIVRKWIMLHEAAGTPDKIQAGDKIGPCMPGAWKPVLYRVGTEASPLINPTAIQWMFQWLQRTLAAQSSARNNRKRWTATLQGAEHEPLFNMLPLRIYRAFAKLEEAEGELYLSAKLLRAEPGGPYLPLRMRLRQPRTKDHAADYALALQVACGERPLPCSQIVYDRGRFYLMLTIDRGELPQIVSDRTLYLRSGRRAAYRARFDGRSIDFGREFLLQVGLARQKLIAARSGEPAYAARQSRKWRAVTRNVAHVISRKIATSCLEHNIGRVVVCDGRTDSALNVCGTDGHADISSFPMQMVRVFLTQKLVPHGIKVVERANLRSVKRRIARNRKRLDSEPVQMGAV